ncbi:MAG: class I SAM-dependent methyltransferase [Chloroflexi bacterium]|nr:class I SAM-dependent methyltransferase [Chloroflexota bacterium]
MPHPYSPDYFTARESWRDWRIEANSLIEAAHIAQGAHVLEIGCGGGGLLRMLAQRGAWAVGIDTLDTALVVASKNSDADKRGQTRTREIYLRSSALIRVQFNLVQIGEDNTLPFRDESVDAIIAQHAIEHLPDVDAALREWKRLLKPNGRIALATPNALYPNPAHFADEDHAHIFSPDELRDTIQRSGFVVESCSTIFPFLSRLHPFRAIGVIMYRIFQRAPYFALHGRTILISAQKK